MAQYGTLITTIGLAKIANAQITQSKVNLTHIALGDGKGAHYVPTQDQTLLVNEVWRGPISNVSIDSNIPNRIIADGVVPASIGGFTIREVGLFDEDGDLIAVGQYPETYKPKLAEGIANDLLIHFTIETENASVVNLTVDPTVIIASRKYVDDKFQDLAGVGRTTETVKGISDALNSHLKENTQFYFEEDDGNVFVNFRNKFFYVDEDSNVFFRPNGDGNAGASLGDPGIINIWKVG